MGCNCQNKRAAAPTPLMGLSSEDLLAPSEWGPILWKFLHCLAEHLGQTGSTIIDTDQAQYTETLLSTIPLILPCLECQEHAAAYLAANPVPSLVGLYGNALRDTVRLWLFLFHNAVRAQQGIMITTVEECQALYQDCVVKTCEYTLFVQAVGAAVKLGRIRLENWRKWFSKAERLRIISGNMVR